MQCNFTEFEMQKLKNSIDSVFLRVYNLDVINPRGFLMEEFKMKKLNLAIIGQGRSGKDIHGSYYRSELNKYYTVKYVVDWDEYRRNLAKELYPGCETFSDYKDLFDKKDIDVVVNVTYSNLHFEISKDLLEHGFNVLSDKPFGRTRFEGETLMKIAKDNGCFVMAFQQTFYAPIYLHTKEVIDSGILGKIEQISLRYNSLSRRWDWQTLQKRLGGNCYNTGPHPIGMGLGFIDFDENTRVVYSKLDNTPMTAGDYDDYAKILFTAPGKALVDIEINNTDAYSNYAIKVQGTKGTLLSTHQGYKMKYLVDGENPEIKPIENFITHEDLTPAYCSEKLITHEVEEKYNGEPFVMGTAKLYEDMYKALTEGKEPMITAKHATQVVGIIEEIHAQNPLPLKF